MKTKPFMLICICAIFTVNLTYARWLTIDPLAEKHPAISPYAYCANNPIKFIDPDGRDYFQSKSGSVIWQDDNARKLTINDEKYKNIGASYSQQLTDGSFVNSYQGQAISISATAVDAQQTILENPALAGALLGPDSPLSTNSQQGLMRDLIHNAQGNFVEGAINVGSSSLQTMGDAVATTGYGATATGVGAEAGVPLIFLGNVMKYTGLGIETLMDYMQGNTRKIGCNAFTNGTMGIIGAASRFAPGPYGAVFNLILTPFNVALGYGSSSIQTKNR